MEVPAVPRALMQAKNLHQQNFSYQKENQMKQLCIVLVCIVAMTMQLSAQNKPTLTTEKEKVSYIIGTDIAGNLKKQGIYIDPGASFSRT